MERSRNKFECDTTDFKTFYKQTGIIQNPFVLSWKLSFKLSSLLVMVELTKTSWTESVS